ncbi:acyl-CoA desaturase, partial [Crocinitomicaceae bacterium]|nr:acyl-CoA desaturase [Crocinitomicaceae bacterium]
MAEKTLVKQNQKGTYNWNMVVVLTLIPLIGVFGTGIYVYNQGVVWQEPLLLFILWFLSGMGITMGYHRLFSHKAYKTNVFVEWLLMIFGSMALENTILKWCSDHRIHHTKAETKEDPYSITEGFWHAHIGWIVKNGSEENNRVRGVKDLKSKSAVVFQNKYYFTIGIIGGFIIPLAIGFIYGRPMGALLWAGFLRLTIVHHATFFINSMCHYFGRQTYDIKSTARDSWFVSWFTFGEGYHNYHHKFQWDYRNGVKWFAYDPSKWIIKGLSFFGITYDLKEVKENVIEENKLNNIKVQLFEMFKISGS